MSAPDINALIAAYVEPLNRELDRLRSEIETLRAQTERAETADSFPPCASTKTGRYEGQVRFLTDKGYPAYWSGGAWKKFSDNAPV